MRKCALLFILLVMAIFLFKLSGSDSQETMDTLDAKELVSIPKNEGLVKN